MKKIFLLITSLVFLTTIAFPQSKVNVNSLTEYGGKAYKVDDDKPFTGRVFDLNKSTGKKKMEGQYKNGLKNGKWTYWYGNGQKHSLFIYKNGKSHGKWTKWYENGKKKGEETYKDGKRDGKYTRWYENGQKEEEATIKDCNPDGPFASWYENGQKEKEGIYKGVDRWNQPQKIGKLLVPLNF